MPAIVAGIVGFTSGLNRFAADMSDTKSENSLCRHQPKMFRTQFLREKLAVALQGKPARNFERRPKLVFRAGRHRVGGTQDDVARERVALRHVIESGVDLFRRHLPSYQRTVGEIGSQKRLPHPPNRPGLEHRRDSLHHGFHRHAGTRRNLRKRIPDEPLDLVLGDGEDFRVDGIGMLYRTICL